MGQKQEKDTKTLAWARWIAKRPGIFFGVGLTVHISFVVISVALYVTGYKILPIVFDDIPLEIRDEEMYRRNEAWYNRDEQIDDVTIDARSKRDTHRDSDDIFHRSRNIEMSIKVGKQPLQYETLEEQVITSIKSLQQIGPHMNNVPGFDKDTVDKWTLNTRKCCVESQSLRMFSTQFCDCNPTANKKHNRLKRDLLNYDDDIPHEREYEMTSIFFIYESEDGNILTKENLQQIAEFEYNFYNREDFQTKYCRLTEIFGSLHCQNFFSILRFFDGTYSFSHDDLFDPSFTNVSKVLSIAYDSEETQDMMNYFLHTDSIIDTSTPIISSRMTRSMLTFGYPLAGYSDDDDYNEQENIWNKWAYKEMVPMAIEKFDNGLGTLKFYFFGQDLYWREALNQVFVDWYLLIGAFVFIFIFMWFQTGSLFVTFFGILSIITSFIGANIIYNCIIGYKFFGIFNVLAIFIILGIGADDIFIYSDSWKAHLRGDLAELDQKISQAFKRASVAMFVTSLTTMAAFFVSSFSPLLSVSAFGTFAGLTVLVNYISVITYFPGVVNLHHLYFDKKTCLCCGERNMESTKTTISNGTDQDSEKQISNQEVPEKEIYMIVPDRANKAICDFLGGPYYRFVTNKVTRWVILVIFVALLGCAAYLTTTIKPASREFQLFDSGHYYEISKRHNTFSFKSNVKEANTVVGIAWGLQKQDKSMCSKLNYDEIDDCAGNTVWEETFDLTDGESQMALLRFCKELKNATQDQKDKIKMASNSITNEGNVTCFIDDMADFYKDEGSKSAYPTGTDLALPITLEKVQTLMLSHPDIYKNGSHEGITRPFEMALNFWLTYRYTNETVPKKIRDHRRFLGQRDISYENLAEEPEEDGSRGSDRSDLEIFQTKLMYAGIEIDTLIKGRKISLQDGLVIMDIWEEFVKAKMAGLPETLSKGFQFTWLWSWFNILQNLAIQSITTCVIGIALSFVVIFLGTTNIITGLCACFLLMSVTLCVIAVIPLAGWEFGLLESLNLCLIVGLAVDYIVHFAEAYHMSNHKDRASRLQETLQKVGVSVLSGAITTLGASFFMLFAKIVFFKQFGIFIFCTIGFSMLFTMFIFVSVYSMIGPQNYTGSFLKLCKDRNKYKEQDDDTSGNRSSGVSNPAFENDSSEVTEM